MKTYFVRPTFFSGVGENPEIFTAAVESGDIIEVQFDDLTRVFFVGCLIISLNWKIWMELYWPRGRSLKVNARVANVSQ